MMRHRPNKYVETCFQCRGTGKIEILKGETTLEIIECSVCHGYGGILTEEGYELFKAMQPFFLGAVSADQGSRYSDGMRIGENVFRQNVRFAGE